MKINKSYLEQIIKEEYKKVLQEDLEQQLRKKIASLKAMATLNTYPKITRAAWAKQAQALEKQLADQLNAEEEDLTTQAVYDQEQREKALGPISSIDPDAAAKEQDQEEYRRQDIEKGIENIGKASKWAKGAAQTATDAIGKFMKGTEQPAKKSSGRSKASRQGALSKRIGRPIANIQNRLRKYFPKGSRTFAGGKADGKYGRPGGETESAIKRFQKDYMKDTKPDGLWGPGTEKGYKKVTGGTKSGLMLPPTGTEPQKGKPQKSTAVAKSTGIKSIEQLKKEKADALKYAQVAWRGGFAEKTKAKALGRFKVARRALELAQAQEKIGKYHGIAKARGETNAERDTAIARAPGRGK